MKKYTLHEDKKPSVTINASLKNVPCVFSILCVKLCQRIFMLVKNSVRNVYLKFIFYILYRIISDGIIDFYKFHLIGSYNIFSTEFSTKKMSAHHVNARVFLNQIKYYINQSSLYISANQKLKA